MNLAVFGATGRTGRQLVKQALLAGYGIRALVRTADRAGRSDAVQLMHGSVLDTKVVRETVADAEAVLSCLGTKLTSTFAPRGRIMASAMAHIVDAMRVHGVHRIIAVSTYGAGDSWPRLDLAGRIMMGTLLRGEIADKNAMETSVRASGLDWTIVRPVNLKDGPSTGTWRIDTNGSIGLSDWISRADVAAFMLAALNDQASVGQTILIRSQCFCAGPPGPIAQH